MWQSSSAEIGQLRSCTAHVVGRILVMCQYSRCTVTCTTQLSCPASLVAIHWYNPVLIWVRFFSKTCPGLEMSETGKTTPGLTKKRLSAYTGGWNTAELIEPPDQISSRANDTSRKLLVNLLQNTTTQTSLCRVEHATASSCSGEEH